jgi:HKD family nuclease
MIFDSSVGRGTAHGFLDQTVDADQLYRPQLIINDDENTMVRAIKEELGHRSASTSPWPSSAEAPWDC